MTDLYLTHPELREEQQQALRRWNAKDKELVGYLANQLVLAGLLAGAELDAIAGVLGGCMGLSDPDIDKAETKALEMLNDPWADASDKRRHFRELYELTAQVVTAHQETSCASNDFIQAVKAELTHWVNKRRNERRPT